MTQTENYRENVFELLPGLEALDGLSKDGEEVESDGGWVGVAMGGANHSPCQQMRVRRRRRRGRNQGWTTSRRTWTP